jgi:hypothetical protein
MWPCPDRSHPQTGGSPPVSVRTVNGVELWRCHGQCQRGGDVIQAAFLAEGHRDRNSAVYSLADRLHLDPDTYGFTFERWPL